MFHTTIDSRFDTAASIERLLAFGDRPLAFPLAMDLCREQVQAPADCEALRFADAARKSASPDAFRPAFAAGDWRVLSSFCVVRRLPAGQRVAAPGRGDRALRFVVEGSLGEGTDKVLAPGAILGEDALFSDAPRERDVRALEDSLVLELSLPRRKELTASCPEIAFELLRAAGALIAARARVSEARDALAAN